MVVYFVIHLHVCTPYRDFYRINQRLLSINNSDVNKDLTLKAKAKDSTFKAKAKAKDSGFKAKAKDSAFKANAKAKDRNFEGLNRELDI